MPLDTLSTLVGKVQQRVGPLPDYYLVVDAVVNAAREVYRDRDWTFRRRKGQFLFNASYSTGTVSITRGNEYADFSGAALSQSFVGRVLRAGGNERQIVTIRRVDGNRAYFDQQWGSATVSNVRFEIYNAYCTVPQDFSSFISIVDLQRSMQLDWWTLTADDLDRIDPQRSHGGGDQAYAMVLRDYTEEGIGVIGSLIQARGSGNVPVAGGEYAGIENAVFTVEMTSATVFQWKKDGGAYVTGVTLDAEGQPQELQDGLTVAFPPLDSADVAIAYTSGDVFVIPAAAASASGLARYEAWPHIKADEMRPYLYLAQPLDLSDPGATLSRYIPGDLVLEKALAAMARWKHKENAYYDLRLAQVHEDRARVLLVDVIREDEARESTMLSYDNWANWPTYDSGYFASHDLGYELNVL